MQKEDFLRNATCPGCGLLCDDIELRERQEGLSINIDCPKARQFFERPLHSDLAPMIKGKPVTLEAAILQALSILQKAKRPVFAGLSTDLAGFRAIHRLAEKTGAMMAHMNAESSWRNMRVLQQAGWQTTTLTEVKNRADVVLCFGTDVVQHNPRFFERCLWVEDAMFVSPSERTVIYIGDSSLDTQHGTRPDGALPIHLQVSHEDLPDIAAALRALVQDKPLSVKRIGGIEIKALKAIAEQLKQASYAVLVWVSKDMDFPEAELTIQNLTETVIALNRNSRAMGLPLGGSDGDTTVNYAHTWLTSLAPPQLDLAQADAVVWVNSFSPDRQPPELDVPIIMLGHPDLACQKAEVFIPIATPGLDCNGVLFRVDSSVVLPLQKTRQSEYPTLGHVISSIERQFV